MRELTLVEDKVQGNQDVLRSAQDESLQVNSGGFRTVPSLQRLLDVISSIIAEEYIMIAKQAPGAYLELRRCPLVGKSRKCAPSGQGVDK